jgi:N-dimethylarginine dimethylaminohydrolase
MSEPFVFLMCKPEYYGVSYVINPWMTGNVNKTSVQRAQEQWDNLVAHLAALARIEFVEPQPGLPDMPFTANAGFVFGRTAIPSRFRCVERQGEEPHFNEWFVSHGFAVDQMPAGIPFEGAGDALIDRGAPRIWAGWGHRSASESHDFLRDRFGVEVISLRLVDDRFYHLDTCLCPLEGGYVMYYPPAFDDASNRAIERATREEQRIIVADDDAVDFACNAVNVGDAVIVNRASAGLTGRLTSLGLRVMQTELTEFLKAGGAAKCLTLRLNEPGVQSNAAQRTA